MYRDEGFVEQFIFVERKRDTGYRISADKKPLIVRTKKAAFDFLYSFLLAAVSASERYTVITVAEYADFVGRLKFRHYSELKERLADKARYDEYLNKKFPK